VFKIETIGDAWMGVTNLVKDQPDHAKRLAQFAIAAVQAASETPIDLDDLSRGNVQIRVGFHSGPVLSNVIGSRNPKFSIFGDTVNTSARMESHSLPGRIQCSERAAELLKAQGPEVPLAYRGTIHVKGKGEMNTYWVNEVANVAKASSALKDIQEGDKKYVDDAEESEAQNGMVGDDDLPPV
jgi:class 3 adenylate cyclase